MNDTNPVISQSSIQTIQIGNVAIEKTAALAPMASVADKAYRLICKEYGAAYCVSEMVSAKALFYSDKKSRALLPVTPEEEPMAVQLFGSEPDVMAYAVKVAEEYHPRLIDVNMGCPVPKVAGNGCGCALMKTPALAADIVRAMTNATSIPITVKFRKGWDEEHGNAVEFAKRMEQAGAAAITIHGRTRKQMYLPPVDLDIIRQVKEAVSIPVIGNGGILSGEDAARMYRETGCDLVMIGQGSYGMPWIFREIRHYLETGESLPKPPLSERLSVMQRHISMMVEFKGEDIGMREGRKIAAWYIKGSKGAAAFRGACGKLKTLSDLFELTEEIKSSTAQLNCSKINRQE